jgi:hypothetical protein
MSHAGTTFFVYAKVMEPIQPLDRADRYEDPLEEILEQCGLGEVTGGGSQLTRDGEIVFAGIDLELANLDDAVEVVRQSLETSGAPNGSELQFEREGQEVVLPFGTTEGVFVYLDGVGLPDDVYSSCDINLLADKIHAVLVANDAGEIRGSWAGPRETAIYIFGANADTTYSLLAPILMAYPLCGNARVVIAPGLPSSRTIRVPCNPPQEPEA